MFLLSVKLHLFKIGDKITTFFWIMQEIDEIFYIFLSFYLFFDKNSCIFNFTGYILKYI